MNQIKVKYLKIKNVGIIADTTITFDKPLLLFYGEVKQGKSTILNAIRWCFGGSFPSDIIRHGEKEAAVELGFDGGLISREWYIAKDKSTKARPITFVRNGRPVQSPVAEIERFLNPFLLNQDHLKNMGEPERKSFFAEVLAIDTSELDGEAFECERKAKDLRAKIKGYGEIDLTPVQVIDDTKLREQLKSVKTAHSKAVSEISDSNSRAIRLNADIERNKEAAAKLNQEIARLKANLKASEGELVEISAWLERTNPQEIMAMPPSPDTSAIEAQINEAAANKVRLEQLEKNVKRQNQKEADETALALLETRQRAIKTEKTAKLKGVSEKSGIKGLSFDGDGTFTYQGTQAGMLSTSQIMQLSSELSALYPEGFGIDLIDRGESLGRTIFDYVNRAKERETTILATIVGEAPSQKPENIGVFVVEDGKVITK
jgi:DNA repair exonuclease SbcCD ATPase subunit